LTYLNAEGEDSLLYVEHLRDVDAATWDRLLLESPGGGHALQTYAWGEFKATQGWKPSRLALKEGDRVLGVAQMLVRQVPGTTGAVAYCAKGPWIDWSNGEQTRMMLEGMEHFARRQGAYILKVESELLAGPGLPSDVPPSVEGVLGPIIATARGFRRRARASQNGHSAMATAPTSVEEEKRAAEEEKRVAEARQAILDARERQARDGHTPGRAAFAELGFVKSRWDMQFRTTMVVDLDRSPEAILARMKSKTRYNVNLARRKGVEIVQDDSQAARSLLHDMYVHTGQRDGFLLRPKSYFDGAWDTMIDAGHAHIFFAYHEGRPLAGLLAYTFGDKAWYQVGASYTEGRNLMPAPAIQYAVMEWAQQRGMTYYDLVAIPNVETISARDSMWGLYVFKSGFGGRPVEWAGCLDKIIDPRGAAWEAIEPAYYRFYRWRVKDVMY